MDLTYGSKNEVAVAAEGAIPPLAALLRSGSDKSRANAAKALGNLVSSDGANKTAVARAGAIPLLMELSSGSLRQRQRQDGGCAGAGKPPRVRRR
jgi:vacuolar protein 8